MTQQVKQLVIDMQCNEDEDEGAIVEFLDHLGNLCEHTPYDSNFTLKTIILDGNKPGILLETVRKWKLMFDRINADNPESYVPYTDVEYYAEQMSNIFDEYSYTTCYAIAQSIYLLAQLEPDMN